MDLAAKSPLDKYREKASFEWKKLRKFLDTEENTQQTRFYEELQRHPTILSRPSITPSQEDQKKIATKEMLDLIDIRRKLKREFSAELNLTGPSSSMRHSLSFDLFSGAVSRLGTERHQEYCEKGYAGEIIGTFALTEVGHGSHTKSIQTTATYDKETKEFIIHTPNFFAAKCWMGNLGKKATHIILYAQLILPDGKNYGLHAFIVNVRNSLTLLPYPGISITDIGEKNGLQHLDNGLIMFNEYRIPKANLLNQTADVSDDGTYISTVVNPKRQFANSLSMLSNARVSIAGFCAEYMRCTIAIAIRYAALVHRSELPILERPSQLVRLIPCLALAYVNHIVYDYLASIQNKFTSIDNDDVLTKLSNEFHAVSSAAKSVCSSLTRDGIRECKEVCGDGLYLTIAGMEENYSTVDPSCNYEGDNYVLMQQCASFLLKLWPNIVKGKTINFPLSSVNFLSNAKEILNGKFTITYLTDFIKPDNIVTYYEWLTCYILKETFEKQQFLSQSKLNGFWIKNESQVYFCRTLGTAYIMTFFVKRFKELVLNAPDHATKTVLLKLLSLYGLWNLQKYIHYFYQGGYATTTNFAQFTEEAILTLCSDLKDDAVSLVDAISPPDFLVNSVFGYSDGNVYKRLECLITHTQGTFSNVNWRDNLSKWKHQLSKL